MKKKPQPEPERVSLNVQSERFHAFEWLRSEALKGNRHAEVMMMEIIRLNEVERQSKK